jgi:GGDEF domain-containing protein
MELERFGVLFANLHPFRSLQGKLSEEVLNALLRKMADQFKGMLRPSDTMAWSEDGYFLSLFEEIDMNSVPLMIAKRVGKGLNDFIKLHELDEGLRVQVGVIMCDEGYEGAQEVLQDIDFARAFVKSQPDAGHWIYTREEIQKMRATQGL